jgi:hypothetical protein
MTQKNEMLINMNNRPTEALKKKKPPKVHYGFFSFELFNQLLQPSFHVL